jgi:hypothetical protein
MKYLRKCYTGSIHYWNMSQALLVEQVERRILLIRGLKVVLDRDLAQLYGVSTKALNQAMKRNHNCPCFVWTNSSRPNFRDHDSGA